MAKTTKKTEEADKVVVDEAQDITEEETKAEKVDTNVPEDENIDLQKRKAELIEGLIGSAEEKLDSEVDVAREETEAQAAPKKNKTPATEANFERKGAAIAGPFARRRTRPVGTESKPATPVNPRRGVQKIWEDRPINNVG